MSHPRTFSLRSPGHFGQGRSRAVSSALLLFAALFAGASPAQAQTLEFQVSARGLRVLGTASAAVARLTSSASLDFGLVAKGSTPPVRSWQFANEGSTPWSLSVGELPPGYALASNTCTNVAAGQSCAVSLTLDTALERGASTSSVTLTASPAGALRGEGLSVSGAVATAGLQAVTVSTGAAWSWALDIFYDGTHFYAAGNEATYTGTLFKSADLVSWTRIHNIGSSAIWQLTQGANGRLVAAVGWGCTRGDLLYSDNGGSSWTASSGALSSTCLTSVAGAPNGKVLASTATSTGGGQFVSSNNGQTWMRASTAPNTGGGPIATDGRGTWMRTAGLGVQVSTDDGLTFSARTATQGEPRSLRFIQGQFWATTAAGKVCRYAFSADAWSCSQVDPVNNPQVVDIAYGNGTYLATSNRAGTLYKSTDAITWTPVLVPTGSNARLVFAQGKFVVMTTDRKVLVGALP